MNWANWLMSLMNMRALRALFSVKPGVDIASSGSAIFHVDVCCWHVWKVY
jgi:hypothetical protein